MICCENIEFLLYNFCFRIINIKFLFCSCVNELDFDRMDAGFLLNTRLVMVYSWMKRSSQFWYKSGQKKPDVPFYRRLLQFRKLFNVFPYKLNSIKESLMVMTSINFYGSLFCFLTLTLNKKLKHKERNQ